MTIPFFDVSSQFYSYPYLPNNNGNFLPLLFDGLSKGSNFLGFDNALFRISA
ncbi:MAG: hypothetical protein KA508_02555 [Gammaproteobacteria bacterium]|nr:hypothetical protein [Gammaproteobacteria bacterium]